MPEPRKGGGSGPRVDSRSPRKRDYAAPEVREVDVSGVADLFEHFEFNELAGRIRSAHAQLLERLEAID